MSFTEAFSHFHMKMSIACLPVTSFKTNFLCFSKIPGEFWVNNIFQYAFII